MPYINYDENGKITEKFACQQYEGQTFLDENSDEYKNFLVMQENISIKTKLQSQINELDKKSIRAIREPAIKNETTGQTWLEYYTIQIQDLRVQIAALN